MTLLSILTDGSPNMKCPILVVGNGNFFLLYVWSGNCCLYSLRLVLFLDYPHMHPLTCPWLKTWGDHMQLSGTFPLWIFHCCGTILCELQFHCFSKELALHPELGITSELPRLPPLHCHPFTPPDSQLSSDYTPITSLLHFKHPGPLLLDIQCSNYHCSICFVWCLTCLHWKVIFRPSWFDLKQGDFYFLIVVFIAGRDKAKCALVFMGLLIFLIYWKTPWQYCVVIAQYTVISNSTSQTMFWWNNLKYL